MTVWPRSATFAALRTSSSVKLRPDTRFQSRVGRMPGVVPQTPVDQFWLP